MLFLVIFGLICLWWKQQKVLCSARVFKYYIQGNDEDAYMACSFVDEEAAKKGFQASNQLLCASRLGICIICCSSEFLECMDQLCIAWWMNFTVAW
ncbi:hypothetical protein KC19_3G166300 [Ceratodon purpureus]|uniref:Uncharacterized protein n=1 Tax=Ceratodon purpureus TaxID=3225 RepID=A0A8T0IJ81_CERPU|nr:hypothetical protein KC19_3G166300 [Ceratodon purpureus]